MDSSRKNSSNNFLRFIFALFAGVGLLVVVFVVFTLLAPLIFGGAMVLYGAAVITASAFGILGFFSLFWYLGRKETHIKENNDFSIDQGKEIK